MLIAGGGLNSTISALASPFNAINEFKGEYRCIASGLRNANNGQSSGPLEIDRPWDSYTDDHIGLLDHLRIDKFMVMGCCIGGPFMSSKEAGKCNTRLTGLLRLLRRSALHKKQIVGGHRLELS